MATIKSYTDLEQSKVFAKILPLESADMYYTPSLFKGHPGYFPHLKRKLPIDWDIEQAIPCWSLSALLGVLPKGNNISTPKPVNALGYCCWNQYDEIYAGNPVDACYKIILKLNELKML